MSYTYRIDKHMSYTYRIDKHMSYIYRIDKHMSYTYRIDKHMSYAYRIDKHMSYTYRIDKQSILMMDKHGSNDGRGGKMCGVSHNAGVLWNVHLIKDLFIVASHKALCWDLCYFASTPCL